MNAKEFKQKSEILMDTYTIEFVSKKTAIDWANFRDGEMGWIADEDCHAYVFVGERFYSDEEITPAVLRAADYIELSHGDGWMFYIGRNANAQCLDDCFESSVGWAIDCGLEFGELLETEDGKIVKAVA